MKTDPKHDPLLAQAFELRRRQPPPRPDFAAMRRRIKDAIVHPPPRPRLTFWQWLRTECDYRPALICGTGVVVCTLMLVAMVKAMQVEAPSPALVFAPPANDVTDVLTPAGAPVVAAGAGANPILKPAAIPGSTAPFIPTDSPFDPLHLRTDRASFNLATPGN
jgi:hypothetical protein